MSTDIFNYSQILTSSILTKSTFITQEQRRNDGFETVTRNKEKKSKVDDIFGDFNAPNEEPEVHNDVDGDDLLDMMDNI